MAHANDTGSSGQPELTGQTASLFDDAVDRLRGMFAEAVRKDERGRPFYGSTNLEIPWADGKPTEVLASKTARVRPARGGK